jgi:hypothetical protein
VPESSPVGPRAALPALPTAPPTISQSAALPGPIAPQFPEIVPPTSVHPASDMALQGGPVVRRGDALLELRPDYLLRKSAAWREPQRTTGPHAVKAFFAIAAALLVTSARTSGQTNYHFFPKRPMQVTLHHDYGILLSYGSGNDTAGLAIKRPTGERVQFFMAFPTVVNGRRFSIYSCTHYQNCAPPGIQFGKTAVTVTYWTARAPWGENVEVSDTIDTR